MADDCNDTFLASIVGALGTLSSSVVYLMRIIFQISSYAASDWIFRQLMTLIISKLKIDLFGMEMGIEMESWSDGTRF